MFRENDKIDLYPSILVLTHVIDTIKEEVLKLLVLLVTDVVKVVVIRGRPGFPIHDGWLVDASSFMLYKGQSQVKICD
jgi:hypothetical protein